MEETTKLKQQGYFGKNELLAPFLVALIGAIILIAAFFLPYQSATSEHKEYLQSIKDEVDAELNITYGDAINISIFDCVKLYNTLGGTLGKIVVAIIGSVGALSALTLLFVLLKKPIATLIFNLMTFGAFYILSWDFRERGVMQNGYYQAGVSYYLYYVGTVVVFAGAIWMLIIKIKRRRK